MKTDEYLVREAQGGQQEAASDLIQRYYPRVYSFVSHLSGMSKAEDLTQEAFARALEALPRFNGDYRFGPWVLRIAKNVCIDEARRDVHRAAPTDPGELPDLESAPRADDVWESMSRQLSTATVHRALTRLPKRQRTVLVLRELEERSYADIAGMLGINPRAVEISLARARSRFRLELARLDGSEGEPALCRRILRRTAGNPDSPRPEVTEHLRWCHECQARLESIGSAEKLLGAALLPPLASPLWLPEVLASFARRSAAKGRGLLEFIRLNPEATLSPLARIGEVAASIAIVAAISLGSVVGANRARVAQAPGPVLTGGTVANARSGAPAADERRADKTGSDTRAVAAKSLSGQSSTLLPAEVACTVPNVERIPVPAGEPQEPSPSEEPAAPLDPSKEPGWEHSQEPQPQPQPLDPSKEPQDPDPSASEPTKPDLSGVSPPQEGNLPGSLECGLPLPGSEASDPGSEEPKSQQWRPRSYRGTTS
ncbi:MAG: sigma-70 family RNA polymerase sigma factor [Actinomycetota bacterium]